MYDSMGDLLRIFSDLHQIWIRQGALLSIRSERAHSMTLLTSRTSHTIHRTTPAEGVADWNH